MKPSVAIVLLVLALPTMTACGEEEERPRTEPVSSFEPNPRGERVFEAYARTGGVTESIVLPQGSREVAVYIDCTGTSGEVKVTFSSAGGAAAGCTNDPDSTGAMIFLGGDGSLLPRRQEMTITPPGSQKWSVSVDAGKQLTSN